MLRWLLVCLFAASLCFSTVGCGSDDAATTPPPEETEGEAQEETAPAPPA